jgi:histidinol-phosphate aminotransferase
MSFPYTRAVSGIQNLTPYRPGKPIEEVERELGIPNATKLASNENPLGPSPLVLAAMRECLDSIALYPDANGFRLKNALSNHLNTPPEQMTLGNGSNDVLDLIARVFVGPGDEVIFSQYAFLVYALVASAVGGEIKVTPAVDWGHDLMSMAECVTERTKVVFIANPNNPTGTYNTSSDLKTFLESVPSEVIVVLDEAYFEYVRQPDYPNGLEFLDGHSNLIVVRTFSKAYGLAGLRIGYGIAGDQITDLLNRVRQPFNVNQVAQMGALAALEDPEHIARSQELNQQQMQRLCTACDELGLPYIPSVANFLTIEFGQHAAKIHQSLLEQGIIVRPLGNYDMPHHLRVTIGRSHEIDQLIDAIKILL